MRLSAACADADGTGFQSWADYKTGPEGIVNPTQQAPRAGTYSGVDGFGLWWSMSSITDRPFAADLRPIRTEVSAEIDGQVVAQTSFERLNVGSEVAMEHVHEAGLRATLFLPRADRAPGVVVLGGSEGGLRAVERVAALLASRGFAALAVAYFAYQYLPSQLVEIPVEYVESAIRWLLAHPKVYGEKVALLGMSRGGELALLAGSFCPQVCAVVGFAASSVVWVGYADSRPTPRSAWTRGGHALPCAFPIAPLSKRNRNDAWSLRDCFLRALERTHQIARAQIQVERILGPLLLVSGGNDQMWPSDVLARLALRRRRKAGIRFRDVHLTYAHAGHAAGRLIGLPAAPTTTDRPGETTRYALGGTKQANARSAVDAWPRVLYFLRENLEDGTRTRRSRR